MINFDDLNLKFSLFLQFCWLWTIQISCSTQLNMKNEKCFTILVPYFPGSATIWELQSTDCGLKWTIPKIMLHKPGTFERNRIIVSLKNTWLYPTYMSGLFEKSYLMENTNHKVKYIMYFKYLRTTFCLDYHNNKAHTQCQRCFLSSRKHVRATNP